MSDILDSKEIIYEKEEEQDWKLILGEDFDYFYPRMKNIQSGNILSFNFNALLFNNLWLLYLRIYTPAFIFLFLIFCKEAFQKYVWWTNYDTIIQLDKLGTFPYLVFIIIIGFTADWFYYQRCKRKLRVVKNKKLSKIEYENQLHKIGKKSMISAAFGLVLLFSIPFITSEFIDYLLLYWIEE